MIHFLSYVFKAQCHSWEQKLEHLGGGITSLPSNNLRCISLALLLPKHYSDLELTQTCLLGCVRVAHLCGQAAAQAQWHPPGSHHWIRE